MFSRGIGVNNRLFKRNLLLQKDKLGDSSGFVAGFGEFR